MVFNGKVFDFDPIIDTLKFRLASWFKAKWPKTPSFISDIVRFRKVTQISKRHKNSRRAIAWASPPYNHMKFNVDGSARGKPGPAGIGGVLRDCNAFVKAIFFKAIGGGRFKHG